MAKSYGAFIALNIAMTFTHQSSTNITSVATDAERPECATPAQQVTSKSLK
jgi:hypothetical protein